MILSESEQFIYSSIGWVDGGTIWEYEVGLGSARSLRCGDGKYLSLHEGSKQCFSAAHFFDGNRFEITVHQHDRDAIILSRFRFVEDRFEFEGDLQAWDQVPKAYVAYCMVEGVKDYWLFLLNPKEKTASFQNFPWFDDSFDKGYQGIIGAYEIPNSTLLIITIQRDSNPVLWDPMNKKSIRHIELAGRFGNPKLRFTKDLVLFADDYDTLIKIDPQNWEITASRKLQNAAEGNIAQFIGDFWLDANQDFCVVARPFSGDVVVLDTKGLDTRYMSKTGGKPLKAVMLQDKRIFARDWQTGDVLQGTVNPH